ncbi:MAG: putative lipid flippase FtsW, partial [Candidatus Hydrogenedentes bacterium]|nr:putative lipid flippase FtsW [Candidatus Hydrogenedentota bacterium]
FKTQVVSAIVGLVAMFVAAHTDYHRLRVPGIYRPLVAFSLLLLVLVLIPGLGVNVYGAQRWLRIFTFQFQPSELAKFAVIVLLAVKLTERQDQIRSFWKGFLPPVFLASCFAALILLEKDLGMPVVIMTVAFVMIFAAGCHWAYVVSSIFPAILGVLVLSVTSPHRLRRLFAFWDKWEYRDNESYQLIQALAAFSRGGIFGRGPGASEQKLDYLPAAHTDFIFAIWSEEMGLIGSLVLVGLYVALLIVAIRVAMYARDLFGTLLATGIITLITFQAAFIMAVTTGLLPTKGLPLPFVSYGGTALIIFLGLMGILINVGRQAQAPEEDESFTRRWALARSH